MRDELTPSGLTDETGRPSTGSPVDGDSPLSFVLRALWQSRYLAVLTVVIGTALGLFFGIVKPNEYESIGKLIVKPGLREAMTPETALSGGDTGAAFRNLDALKNELHILQTRKLYEKVVEALGLDTILEPYDPTATDGPDTSWIVSLMHELQAAWFSSRGDASGPAPTTDELGWLAATLLAENVLIDPVPGSTVLTVSYIDHSPDRAALIVDAVLQAALEVHSEVFATADSFDVLEAELKKAEEEARVAEAELAEFRQENGIYDIVAQRTAMITAIGDLERQIENDAIELTGKAAEQKHLEHLLDQALEAQSPAQMAQALQSPEHAALMAHMRQLQLIELELPLTSKGLPVEVKEQRRTRLREMIDDVEQELAALEVLPAQTDLTRQQDLEDVAVAITGLEKRRKIRKTLRDATAADLVELEKLAVPLGELEREAQNKRALRDSIAGNLNNLSKLRLLDQLNISNLSILSEAEYLPIKIGPNRMKYLMLGGVLSAMLAVLIAVVRSFLDPRIRHPVELARLDVPIHGILGRRKKISRTRSQLPEALYSTFRDVESEIVSLWARLPLDRRMEESLTIGFVTDIVSRDTSVVAGIAALGIAAMSGESVCYVSCQNAPWLLRRLNVKATDGWGEVIDGAVELEDALVQVHGMPNLKALPVGQGASRMPPITGPGFEALLQTLKSRFRYVLVDVPSFAERPESRVLLQIIDAAEIVLRTGRSTVDGVRDVIHTVRNAGATISGIALLQGSKSYK